jgi:hypothetical protein
MPATTNGRGFSPGLALILALYWPCGSAFAVVDLADEGPGHDNPALAIGVDGALAVSPSVIVNRGTASYTYTGPGNPGWSRLRGEHALYFDVPDGAVSTSIPWGTVVFEHLAGCGPADAHCTVDVNVIRAEGERVGERFLPNCRARYYLGLHPTTAPAGGQAGSDLALFVLNTGQAFDVPLGNPLTLSATGRVPDCPDVDAPAAETSIIDVECRLEELGIAVTPDDAVEGAVLFSADLYNFCDSRVDASHCADEDCYEAAVDACLQSTVIDWDFGDGTLLRGSTRERHVFAAAGVYRMTADIDAAHGRFPGGACTLSLAPPGVRVDVRPVGAKSVISAAGELARKASLGDRFEVEVEVRTTAGFGLVQDIDFTAVEGLRLDSGVFTVASAPLLPTAASTHPANTRVFAGVFVVEAVGEGTAAIDAPVSFVAAGERGQAGDAEDIIVDAQLEVTLAAPPDHADNQVELVLGVRNVGTQDLLDLSLLSGAPRAQSLPGATATGSLALVRGPTPPLPAILAPGDVYAGRLELTPLAAGEVRLVATVVAAEVDGDVVEKSIGADILVQDAAMPMRSRARLATGLNEQVIEAIKRGRDILDVYADDMFARALRTPAADVTTLDAAALGRNCDRSPAGADLDYASTPMQAQIAEIESLPAAALSYLQSAAIDDDPFALYLAAKRGEQAARDDLVGARQAEFPGVEDLLVGLDAVFRDVHLRRRVAAHLTREAITISATADALARDLYAALTRDGASVSALGALAADLGDEVDAAVTIARVAACRQVADAVEARLSLLRDGNDEDFVHELSRVKSRFRSDLSLEMLSAVFGAELTGEVLSAAGRSNLATVAAKSVDIGNSKYRDVSQAFREQAGSLPGSVLTRFARPLSPGALDSFDRRRLRYDTLPPNAASGVRATAAMVAGESWGSDVAGLSPAEQARLQTVLAQLEAEFPAYAGRLALDITPANPYGSVVYRKREGRLPVTPEQGVFQLGALSFDDVLLGAPREHLGELGIFKPDAARFASLPASLKRRLAARFAIADSAWNRYHWRQATDALGVPSVDAGGEPVDDNGRNRPALLRDIELAARPGGHTFQLAWPGKDNRVDPMTGELLDPVIGIAPRAVFREIAVVRRPASDSASETILLQDRTRLVDRETGLPTADAARGVHPPVGAGMNRPVIGLLDGSDFVPADLPRLEDRLQAGLRELGLPFTEHGISRQPFDVAHTAGASRIALAVERMPESRGRAFAQEFITYRNAVLLQASGRTEQALRDSGAWIDAAAYVGGLEFGTLPARVVSVGVAVVEGNSQPLTRIDRSLPRVFSSKSGDLP